LDLENEKTITQKDTLHNRILCSNLHSSSRGWNLLCILQGFSARQKWNIQLAVLVKHKTEQSGSLSTDSRQHDGLNIHIPLSGNSTGN
jgi:hypothetical protein